MGQIFLAIVWLILWALITTVGGFMTKNSWEKLCNKWIVHTGQSNADSLVPSIKQNVQEDTNIKRKGIKIKIARCLEDAEAWLPKQKSVFLNQIDRIMNNAAGRNMVHSGSHVKLHINNSNSFIEMIDVYLKDMTRQIQDFLLEIGEDNLEAAKDFQNEYRRFEAFKQASEVAVDWAKQQNYSVCSRFTDKPTLDNILKSIKYVR